MTADPRFIAMQTSDQRAMAASLTGEAPWLADFRGGRLPGVTQFVNPGQPKPAKRKLSSQPSPVDSEVAKLRGEEKRLRENIRKADAELAARAESARLQSQQKALTKKLTASQAEVDRRKEGGLQGKLRLGEFVKSLPRAFARKKLAKPVEPKRERLGFAARIGRDFVR